MRLRSLNLIGFGKYVNTIIDVDKPLLIIYGPNETGKTTVIQAISGILFGFGGRSEDIRKLKNRYRPWNPLAPYRAGLTLAIDDLGDLYVERDFENDQAVVYQLKDGIKTKTHLELAGILKNHLGIGDYRLFESTLLIKQGEISDLKESALSNAVTGKLTGGAQLQPNDIIRPLENRLRELNRGLMKRSGNPGPIKMLKDEIRQIEEKKDNLSSHIADYNLQKKELTEKCGRIEYIEAMLQRILPDIANYEKAQELKKQREELYTQQVQWQKKLEILNTKSSSLKERISRPWFFWLGLIFNLFSPAGLFMGDIGQLIFFFTIITGMILIFQANKIYAKMSAKHLSARETIDLILDGKSIQEIRHCQAEISTAIMNIDTRIDHLKTLQADEYMEIIEQVGLLSRELEQLKNDILRLDESIGNYEKLVFNGEDLWSKTNELEAKKLELHSLEIKKNAVELALNIFREATEEAQQGMAPTVRKVTEALFSKVTGSKYQHIKLELRHQNLSFFVFDPETNSYINVDNLSMGTRDQFYLALRMALADYLTGGSNYPLFFDDPFVHADEKRLLNISNLLQQISLHHQIFWAVKELPNIFEHSQNCVFFIGQL